MPQIYKKFTYQATIKKKLLLCICDISVTFIFDFIMEMMIFPDNQPARAALRELRGKQLFLQQEMRMLSSCLRHKKREPHIA